LHSPPFLVLPFLSKKDDILSVLAKNLKEKIDIPDKYGKI
jgi:hypothetical protein